METIWKMDIITRKWWIRELIKKYEKQNEAASGKKKGSDEINLQKLKNLQSRMRSLSSDEDSF